MEPQSITMINIQNNDKKPNKPHNIQITTTTTKSPKVPCSSSSSFISILAKCHAGYFRITLSLASQALLWKILTHSPSAAYPLRRLPSAASVFVWSLSSVTLAALSFLYILRCLFLFPLVKSEFLHPVGVNYLYAPWISSVLLLLACPFLTPTTTSFYVLWCVFTAPIVVLDVKIYGQWFTKGKRFLSDVANPTSLLSVIGNLVGARAAAEMGWKEAAVCMFSLGMAHYLVLFVTLYQRLSGGNCLPAMLRPVFFLFFAAPSMASLAWGGISGRFDTSAKMLFFLSLFLFLSLVSRPALFRKSMRKFNIAWWAYCFPLTVLALASVDYAQEVKSSEFAHGLMLLLTTSSILVSFALMVLTALNTNTLFPDEDPGLFKLNNTNSKNKISTKSDFIAKSSSGGLGSLTITIEPKDIVNEKNQTHQ
ncbi:S-type anion channel SLAH1 [Linum grandiflorum]